MCAHTQGREKTTVFVVFTNCLVMWNIFFTLLKTISLSNNSASLDDVTVDFSIVHFFFLSLLAIRLLYEYLSQLYCHLTSNRVALLNSPI